VRIRRVVAFVVVAAFAAWSSGAAAKEFRPGDLRACGAMDCVAITNQDVLNAISAFYYGPRRPARIRAPRLGVPFFQLKFTNGYVTGIVATVQLNRFLSYGVNTGQFNRGAWYAVPARAVAGLREATSGLKPLRLTRGSLARSR
jgi:hypothetical protein